MALFPDRPYDGIAEYCDDYAAHLADALASVDRHMLAKAAELLEDAIVRKARLFVCGNGGSAAIANHMVCDFSKGVGTETNLRPRIQSLSEPVALMTAISNDVSYEEIFRFQLASAAEPGDLLVAISSSGNSPNIVNALSWARENDIHSIAMTGFDGGRAFDLAEVRLHVGSSNYGVVEDTHQSLMHLLAQHLRQRHIRSRDLLGRVRF